MNTHQDNSSPKRTYSVALLGKDGYAVRTLKDTTYFTKDITPLLEEVRDRFGPIKAALVAKETVEWMRSIGLMNTIREIEFMMEVISALQEGRTLPVWQEEAKDAQLVLDDRLKEARSDNQFLSFMSKVLSSPYPDDGNLEDITPIDPVTPSPHSSGGAVISPEFEPEQVWPSDGNQSEAFASISVQISGPRSDVHYALASITDALDDEVNLLKAEHPEVRFHISQTLQTVQ